MLDHWLKTVVTLRQEAAQHEFVIPFDSRDTVTGVGARAKSAASTHRLKQRILLALRALPIIDSNRIQS